MGKFDGVLLASDFDNTLLYTEGTLRAGAPNPPMLENNLKALEYFMAEGGRFAVATGRALATCTTCVKDVPMNAPAVVCNGAALYDFEQEKYLEAITLDEEACRRGQQVLDCFPEVAVEAYHIDNVIYCVQPNEVTRKHAHMTHVGVEERASLVDVPAPLGKLLFEGEHNVLKQAVALMEELGWKNEYEIIFSAPQLLEMTRREATKGGMLRRLAARLGISMEHVYCAGDEANDVSMLTIAAEGFAPANCADVVRACGATIVADAREGAIAEIIDILDKRY